MIDQKNKKTYDDIAEEVNQLFLGNPPSHMGGKPGGPSPGLLTLLPALAAMKDTPKEVQRMYRDLRKSQATQNISDQFKEFLTPDQFKRISTYLKGTFFHGTPEPERIIQQGFDPNKIAKGGVRFGEPAGISISGDPRSASGFGTPIRVGLNVDPNRIAPVMSGQGSGSILDAYIDSIKKIILNPEELSNSTSNLSGNIGRDLIKAFPNAREIPLEQALPFMKQTYRNYYGGPPGNFWRDMGTMIGLDKTKEFNLNMSNYMNKQRGIDALLYNPNRYSEAEVRVFDPKNVLPLDMRGKAKWGDSIMQGAPFPEKYLEKKGDLMGEIFRDFSGYPNSLSEYYKTDPKIQDVTGKPAQVPSQKSPVLDSIKKFVLNPTQLSNNNPTNSMPKDKLNNWIDTVKNPSTGVHEVLTNTSGKEKAFGTISLLTPEELKGHFKAASEFLDKNPKEATGTGILQAFYNSIFPNNKVKVTDVNQMPAEDWSTLMKLYNMGMKAHYNIE